MTSDSRISTPVAIVIGSAVIAVGLYLGLRRPPEPAVPTQLPAAASAVSAPGGPAPTSTAPGPTASPPVVDAASARAQAQSALQAQRAALLEKCWKPVAAKHPETKSGKLTVNVSFDAEGTQRARGVSEQRGTGHAELTQCVSLTLQPLAIQPPGAPLSVELDLELP